MLRRSGRVTLRSKPHFKPDCYRHICGLACLVGGPSPGAPYGLQAEPTERRSGGQRRSSRNRGACVTADTAEVHLGESSAARAASLREQCWRGWGVHFVMERNPRRQGFGHTAAALLGVEKLGSISSKWECEFRVSH